MHSLGLACWDNELEEALAQGLAVPSSDDPYAAPPSPEGLAQAAYLVERDRAWNAVAHLIEDPARRILHRDQKGRLVTEAAERVKVSRATIYRYLRRYW